MSEAPYRVPSARHRMMEGARHRATRNALPEAYEMADNVARFVRDVLPDDAGTVHVHQGEDGAAVEVRRPGAESLFFNVTVSVRSQHHGPMCLCGDCVDKG